jgi:hypothetical protein
VYRSIIDPGIILMLRLFQLGRTAHLILMLEILRYYEKLFASQNPQIIASEIHEMVNHIGPDKFYLSMISGKPSSAPQDVVGYTVEQSGKLGLEML